MKSIKKVLEKKYLALMTTILIVCAGIPIGIIIFNNQNDPSVLSDPIIVTINGSWGPVKLDPIEAREPPCVWIISQVTEGLFDYNETTNEIVPNLATSYNWSLDYTELTCNLREDVKFHDKTDFNAEAVKWNFDRMQYMMINNPEQIPEASLWKFSDGIRIIKSTNALDDYSIKFILNRPFVPFLSLLTTWSSFIISPSSIPANRLLDLSTEILIGTGPFKYAYYIPEEEVQLIANLNYWGGKPQFDKLYFKIFGFSVGNENIEAINQSLSTGEILLAAKIRQNDIFGNYSTFKALYESHPSLKINEEPSKTSFNFIGMNNKLLNITWRETLSYAFDYNFYIDNIKEGWAERLLTPIPKGILYSNTEDFDVPIMNLTKARQILINDISINTTGLNTNNDAEWEALVDSNSALANFTFTYDEIIEERYSLYQQLKNDFKKIGVNVVGDPRSWMEIIYMLYNMNGYNQDMLDLFYLGWLADFNDPYNVINQLMSQSSPENYCQIEDSQLETWLDQATTEFNLTKRKELYYNIQELVIEEIYPWILLDIPKVVTIQSTLVKNFIPSCFQWKLDLKSITIAKDDL